MKERANSWQGLALAIGAIVVALGVTAWFDKPEQEVCGRHVALVVDRSGSMEFLVSEVVDNVNAVLDSLAATDRVSILFFEDPYGVIRYVENQPVDEVSKLAYRDYFPLGGTPLYDAVGVAISEVVTPTLGAARESKFGLVIILSDGEENASVRYSLSDARAAVTAALESGIEIRFYGMGPAAAAEARALGIPVSATLEVDSSAAGLDEAFDDVQRSLGQADGPAGC